MSDLYGPLFRGLLYPAWERGVRRRSTLRHLQELDRSQWCSLDELRVLQNRALSKLIVHAFDHSPYYRRTFEQAGLRTSDVQTVEDLRKLPLLTRELAVDSFENRRSTAEPLLRIRKSTSGSTGRPLAFGYDLESEYWRQATKLRGYRWAGYRTGDVAMYYWGSLAAVLAPPWPKRVKVALDHLAKREHYVDCTVRSEETLSDVVRKLRSVRPKVFVCFAQAGAALARHILEHRSRDWEDIRVISGAERLFAADREIMTKAFGPDVFETYGSREVMLIAGECDAHQGLHVSMENLVVEVVVREGGDERPALPGELGEVVVTDLHNYGAPFIRYLNGDLAVALPEGRCVCGRWLDRLQRVEGRLVDTLRDAEGRRVDGLFFNVLFTALAEGVRAFQVAQGKDRSIDIRVVPGARFDESLLETVRRGCERMVPGVALRVHVVPAIARGPGGKSRVVVVES